MLDYHVHTSLSDDSDTPAELMIEEAIRLGIKEIAVTDHHDPDYPDPDFPFNLNFTDYHEMLERTSEKYYKSLNIKKGLELGIQQTSLDKCRASAGNYPYDFIIGSFHMSGGIPVDFPEFYQDRSGIEIQEGYYRDILECVKIFKNYSIIGHMNLVDRYQHIYRPEEPLNPPEIMDIVREILKVIIYDGKGLEINTSSFRYKTPVSVPSPEILKMYKELGGEILTLGSDAHTPEFLSYNFRYAIDLAESCGFRYIASFKEMKPDFIKTMHL